MVEWLASDGTRARNTGKHRFKLVQLFQGSIWQGWMTWILVLTTTTRTKQRQKQQQKQQQINNNCNRTTTTITTATTGQQQQHVKVQITSILVWASRMFSLSAWWPGVTLWGAAISKTTKDGGGVYGNVCLGVKQRVGWILGEKYGGEMHHINLEKPG